MTRESIELRCSRELALWLGAIEPDDVEQHKKLRASGQYMMVRCAVLMMPMFWLYVGKPPTFDSREGS